MITGAHILFYSQHPDSDRAFFRDVLALHSVDAGNGWHIFALPPVEAGVHPSTGEPAPPWGQLYLLCDDLKQTMAELQDKQVHFSDVHEERWGIRTSMRLPSGTWLGLYQPLHPIAIGS